MAKTCNNNNNLTQNQTRTTKRLIIIGSHVRSGGTLLTRCFEDVDGGVRVFNEPEIFQHFSDFVLANKKSSIERLTLLKYLLFALCKSLWYPQKTQIAKETPSDETSTPNDTVSTIVLKLPAHLPWLLKPLLQIRADMQPFFEMSFLFAYRNPIDSFQSWLR